MMIKNVELLSPAGDTECLRAAFHFGADAVYCGGDFMQLRSEKVSFTRQELESAVKYTHSIGKKLYVTVNCFAENKEIDMLADYARYLESIGADAAIISDIGVLETMKNAAPGLTAHISTQANCMNYASARVYYDMGASRVVLARELSIEDIALLRVKTPAGLELEAFVHGAMCMSYSGRCLLSSFMSNRSGNRGECTQPCRWSYYLLEQKRPGEYFEVVEENGASAVLSSHDLNALSFLDELAAAGVMSFKIEGRMKTPYYVATVTNAYRHRIDGDIPVEVLERELEAVSHRPFSSGFYYGKMKNEHFNDGLYHRDCTFCAAVTGKNERGIEVEQRNLFSVGDTLEILSPTETGKSFTVTEIINGNNESIPDAHLVQELVTLPCPYDLEVGDMLRRRF